MNLDSLKNLEFKFKSNGLAAFFNESKYPFIKLKYLIKNNDGGTWGNEVFNDNEGVYVLRSTEIDIEGKWNLENPFKRKLNDEEIEKYKLKENDIIITKSSGSSFHIGKSAIVDKKIENLICCYSNFIQRIRFKNFHPQLYHYIMNSHIVREQYKFLTQSTTGLGNLSAKTLNEIYLPNIPIEEQEKIFKKLQSKIQKIDNLIDQLKKNIKISTDSIIQNIYEVKNYNKNIKYFDEWFLNMPDEWKTIPIRDFFSVISDKDHPNERLLSVTQDRGVVYRDEQSNRVMEPEGDLTGYKLTEPGNFVISLRSSEGGFEISTLRGIVSNAYTVLKPKYKIDKIYYKYLFKSKNFIIELNKFISGIRDGKNINFQDIKNIKIPFKNLNNDDPKNEKILEWNLNLDKKIDNQKKMINILKEYKKTIIFQTLIK